MKIFSEQKGFTIIELMVVVGIVAVISGIFLLNYRQGERNLAIQRSAQIVTQNITRAINNSLGGKEHNGASGTVSVCAAGRTAARIAAWACSNVSMLVNPFGDVADPCSIAASSVV